MGLNVDMKAYIALALLAAVASASPNIRLRGVNTLVKTTCGPDETECPAGCCPEADWFCCPDDLYCAATASDCPTRNIFSLKKKPVKTTCGPDETECPAGCCPEANWFCCPDNRYCAATADDCPAIKLPSLLPKKVVKTTC